MDRGRTAIVVAFAAAASLVVAACSSTSESTSTANAQAGTVAAAGFGDCDVTSDPTVTEITPVKAGVLTMAAALPSPFGYTTNSEGLVNGGYLYCLGAEIANRAGLESIELVNVSLSDLVAGKATGYDVSAWDISVTPERSKVIAFATPYDHHTTGVMVRAGSSVSEQSIATEKIGVVDGSIQQTAFATILPQASITAYPSVDDLYAALLGNEINVVLIDTTIDMEEAHDSDGKLEVIAQYDVGGDVAPVLELGSANVDPVSTIVESIKADGTKDAIWAKWLIPTLGGDPAALPVWTAP